MHEENIVMVHLAGYQSWSEAKKDAAKLDPSIFPNKVVNEPGTHNYYIDLGQYKESELPNYWQQLRQLNFHNVEIHYVLTPPPQEIETIEETAEKIIDIKPTVPEATSDTEKGIPQQSVIPEPDVDSDDEMLFLDDRSEQASASRTSLVKEVIFDDAPDIAGVKLNNAAVEFGRPFSDDPDASSINYARAEAMAYYKPSTNWEFQLTGRLDGHLHTGDRSYSKLKLDYGETFIRYRGESFRATIGAQNVLWGRLDFSPPNDLLGTRDFSRLIADELRDQRRPSFALRLENFFGSYKLDTLILPFFQAAELPDRFSVWSPIDRHNGLLLTDPGNPLTDSIARDGQIKDDDSGFGGAGIRLSHLSDGFDYAITLQRGRHSAPYYEINPQLLGAVASGLDPDAALGIISGAAMTGIHPLTWSIGADAGISVGEGVFRIEATWLSDIPVTRSIDFSRDSVEAISWGLGYEFFPGNADTRISLGLLNRNLLNAGSILEEKSIWSVNGQIENIHSRNRWRERVRFSVGMGPYDLYLNPEIAYIGMENNEFFIGLRIFEGNSGTLGWAYNHHDLLIAGWRLTY